MDENEQVVIGIKYLVIPMELVRDKDLSPTDKLVFALINLLDNSSKHCYASNKYLSDILLLSQTTISNSISALERKNYIIRQSFDGRKRTVVVNLEYQKMYQKNLHELNDSLTESCNAGLQDPKSGLQDPVDYNNIVNSINDKNNKNNISKEILFKKSDQTSYPKNNENESILKRRTLREKMAGNIHKQPEPYIPSSENQQIINLWNSLCPKQMRDGYNYIKKACEKLDKLRKGKLFTQDESEDYWNRKFTTCEIEDIIRNFALACNDECYEPEDKDYIRGINLDDFLYNTYLHKSLFLQYIDEPKRVIEDNFPHITDKLKECYTNIVGGSARFSKSDQEKLINRSIDLIELFYDKKEAGKLNDYMKVSKDTIVNKYVDFITEDYSKNKSEFRVGSMCGPDSLNMFNQYLIRIDIVRK
jgi:DNA-binding MarR family transcriptional regulator